MLKNAKGKRPKAPNALGFVFDPTKALAGRPTPANPNPGPVPGQSWWKPQPGIGGATPRVNRRNG